MNFVSGLFSLEDKTALVTGATSGIGRHVALTLAKAGAVIVLQGRDEEKLDATLQTFREKLPESRFRSLCFDLARLDGFERRVKSGLEGLRSSGLDILVNAAGVNLREPWEKVTADSWQRTLNLNLAAPFFLARGCLPMLRERGCGRIINVASLQTVRAFADSAPYGAAKGGLGQLTRAMAEAWSKEGVNCNAVAPGFFPTPLTESVFSNRPLAEKHAEATAIGRNGELEDLEGVFVFLASNASSYVTGQTIFVDGGYTAK